MKISVILPAYNESEVIRKTLEDSVKELEQQGLDYELLVVDNASTDNTAKIVEDFAKSHPNVRLLRHAQNMGYAQSNLTGFSNSTGDIIAVTDSDGQHSLADLPLFFEKLREGNDVVFGWRKVRHDPALRKIVSAGLNATSIALLGWKLHDINCGFRVITANVARSITTARRVNYFGPELWAQSSRRGYRVAEVIVTHSEREGGTSMHAPWRLPLGIYRAFRYLLALRGDMKEPLSQRAVSGGSI